LDWSEIRGRVVFVPQHAYIADDRSVAWHLRLLSHGEPSDAQLEEAIEAVGLTDVLAQHASGEPAIDTLASELSGGERQRMHLARALLGDPELIVLDEPEAMIDGEGRVWLHGLLERLSKRARLVVIVHDSSVLPEHAHVVVCRADTP
jgi:ABC-type transport system involved in cytochrome bd biosynthesis fused ATPase/permease subunit